MLPAAAGGEETREEGEIMGQDLLLGLGLPPPTMVASGGHGGGSAAHPYGTTTGFDDEPLLSFAAATETASAIRRLPVGVDDGDGVVPAALPASMLKPASSTARWPSAHATLPWPRQRASPLMQRAPCCPGAAAGGLFVGIRRLVAAGMIAAHDDSTAPMTMIYAGSVHAYAGVSMEHAEKIMAMVAKEAHAAGIGILNVQQADQPQLELVAAPAPASTGGAAQMTMHWGLAHHHVNDCLKRTASLARFLNKRKQRAETSAPTILHHPPQREEWFPAQIMDDAPAATVSARTSASLGGMDRRPGASQDHPKRMKASHAEEAEAVSTELKI